MKSTYVQKSFALQKVSAQNAASVLDASSQSESLQRKADMANGTAQRVETPRPNNTGMPDNLKTGIESLSGFSMDDVRVHYNSSKPATVQALAYTQGTDIHVAPGQEKHLPHEAWHVAQQMAGRVSPTTNINGMPVNDNAALEHEADVMGEKAVQCEKDNNSICSMGKCNSIIQMSVSPGDEKKAMARVMASSSRTPVGLLSQGTLQRNGGTSQDPVQCEYGKHISVIGNLHKESEKESTADDVCDSLPCIAFEVVAGLDRANKLPELYEKEIKRYQGKAFVYMGVNAPVPEKSKKAERDGIRAKVERCAQEDVYGKLIGCLKSNHSLTVISFTYTPTNSPAGKYDFPFMEAREMLVCYAHNSGATVFRWMDSDIQNDTSIDEINCSGYAAFDSTGLYENLPSRIKIMESKNSNPISCDEPIVYSGLYRWHDPEARLNGKGIPLDQINHLESAFRQRYWFCKGALNAQQKFTGENCGYIPEPIVYMNRAAHSAVGGKLKYCYTQLGDACQQNEGLCAFKNLPMVFLPTFSVCKPVKEYFDSFVWNEEDVIGSMKLVRQSAFGAACWQGLDVCGLPDAVDMTASEIFYNGENLAPECAESVRLFVSACNASIRNVFLLECSNPKLTETMVGTINRFEMCFRNKVKQIDPKKNPRLFGTVMRSIVNKGLGALKSYVCEKNDSVLGNADTVINSFVNIYMEGTPLMGNIVLGFSDFIESGCDFKKIEALMSLLEKPIVDIIDVFEKGDWDTLKKVINDNANLAADTKMKVFFEKTKKNKGLEDSFYRMIYSIVDDRGGSKATVSFLSKAIGKIIVIMIHGSDEGAFNSIKSVFGVYRRVKQVGYQRPMFMVALDTVGMIPEKCTPEKKVCLDYMSSAFFDCRFGDLKPQIMPVVENVWRIANSIVIKNVDNDDGCFLRSLIILIDKMTQILRLSPTEPISKLCIGVMKSLESFYPSFQGGANEKYGVYMEKIGVLREIFNRLFDEISKKTPQEDVIDKLNAEISIKIGEIEKIHKSGK